MLLSLVLAASAAPIPSDYLVQEDTSNAELDGPDITYDKRQPTEYNVITDSVSHYTSLSFHRREPVKFYPGWVNDFTFLTLDSDPNKEDVPFSLENIGYKNEDPNLHYKIDVFAQENLSTPSGEFDNQDSASEFTGSDLTDPEETSADEETQYQFNSIDVYPSDKLYRKRHTYYVTVDEDNVFYDEEGYKVPEGEYECPIAMTRYAEHDGPFPIFVMCNYDAPDAVAHEEKLNDDDNSQ